MNLEIFKAYDIRGRYPDEIDESAVQEIVSVASVHWLKEVENPIIVVGHDARLSSPSLYRAALQALKQSALGAKIHAVGLITAPALYFFVNHFQADGGIIITASHNPKEYNGLKIVGAKAVPISGEEISRWIT